TEYQCSDGVCPAGRVCIDGRCLVPGADGGGDGDGDGAPIDGAVPQAACGTAALLADDFEDGVQGPQWDDAYENGVTLAETGGQLVLTIPGASATGSAAYISDAGYDLRESRAWVQVVDPGDTATEQEAQFILRTDVDDRAVMKQIGGLLQMYYRDDGTAFDLLEIPFSATDHRWWQMRGHGGSIFFETSDDGSSWVVRHQIDALPIDLSLAQVQVGAADFTGSAGGGTVVFDDVNGGGPAGGAWCAASSLSDDFEDGAIGWTWSLSFDNSGCALVETGGVAQVELSSGSTSHCAYYTLAAFDLRDDAISVQVTQMLSTSMSEVRAYFRVWLDSDDFLDIMQEDGTLYFDSESGGTYTAHASVAWSLADHGFWRIREQAGTVYWDTSPDGTAWNQQAEAPDPFDLSAVQIGLGGQALTAPATDPGHVSFDRYNLP
ncbi:MAG TPA: hypothetical protein VL172_00355, partial [Kofleriaceae bacterium]|nr:hypothetical protein [Kofleriaceae bacterium]